MVFSKFGNHRKPQSLLSSLNLNSQSINNEHPIELSIDIESSPCVLYGSATESSGCVLSGLLNLKVKEPHRLLSSDDDLMSVSSTSSRNPSKINHSIITQKLSHSSHLRHDIISPLGANNSLLDSISYTKISLVCVTLSLIQKVYYNHPFQPNLQEIMTCMNCKTKITELNRWDIVNKRTKIPIGIHAFPFSHLIPGSTLATSNLGSTSTTQVKYELVAVATYLPPKKISRQKEGERLIQLTLPISITRSILRGPDRNSLRVFPPTDVTATAVLPNVVYPRSSFPLELRLEGVSSEDRRWRMRKLVWRIEEKVRVRCNACNIHKTKLKKLEQETKESEALGPKRSVKQTKWTSEIGPQITVSVATVENTHINLSELYNEHHEDNGNQDMQNNSSLETDRDFIHPSDDAMRQEIVAHQARLRQQQIQEELKQETALFTEEIRTIASGDVKTGWKTDFDGNGKIELVTDIDCMSLNSGVSNPVNNASTSRPCIHDQQHNITVACDIEDPNLGIYVNHLLLVEIVVAEEALQYFSGHPVVKKSTPTIQSNNSNIDQRLAELSPMFATRNSTPNVLHLECIEDDTPVQPESKDTNKLNNMSRIIGVPTGAARVLRMQFRMVITERSGLGISWDEEVPPTYQDIKFLSPPGYTEVLNKVSSQQQSLFNPDSLPQNSNISYSNGLTSTTNSTKVNTPTPPPIVHLHSSFPHISASIPPRVLENIVGVNGDSIT